MPLSELPHSTFLLSILHKTPHFSRVQPSLYLLTDHPSFAFYGTGLDQCNTVAPLPDSHRHWWSLQENILHENENYLRGKHLWPKEKKKWMVMNPIGESCSKCLEKKEHEGHNVPFCMMPPTIPVYCYVRSVTDQFLCCNDGGAAYQAAHLIDSFLYWAIISWISGDK